MENSNPTPVIDKEIARQIWEAGFKAGYWQSKKDDDDNPYLITSFDDFYSELIK
jgi:hypothetical protein